MIIEVKDEIARLYPYNVNSEMENAYRGEIVDWLLTTSKDTRGMDMKEVIKMFWDERLN